MMTVGYKFALEQNIKNKNSLLILTPAEAQELGYKAITTFIYVSTESHIMDSMEASMRGIAAVWIASYIAGNGKVCEVELGRRSSEIASGVE